MATAVAMAMAILMVGLKKLVRLPDGQTIFQSRWQTYVACPLALTCSGTGTCTESAWRLGF